MNLPTLRGSGVAARDVHVRTGTNVAIGADLSGRLARLGIRFVPDDTQPGSQEKRELQDALGAIRDHLRDHPPLTQGHVAERHLFRDSVAEIRPRIEVVSATDVAQLTVLDDVPAPGAVLPGATEIRVSPEFLARLMVLDGDIMARLETCSIRLIEDGAGATPSPIEDLRAALTGVRGAIGDEGGRVAFNAGVIALNGLTAADTAAFTVALTDIEATPELATRYRLDVDGAIGVHADLGAAGFPDIHHHDRVYLRDRFDAATRKFMMIKWQIESYPGCPEGIKRELQVCALDFLVHGAMVTMTTGREAMDMPLLEFRGNGVNVDSSYHRAQGKGAVTQLFKELLQENGDYRFLFASETDSKSVAYDLGAGDRRDACVLVDGPGIMRTLENKYAPVRPPIADDAALAVAVGAAVAMPAGQMLDLSAYFVGAATRDELSRRMAVVHASVHANGGMPGIPIFAQFPVAGVTVAVAFDTRPGNDHQRELSTFATFGSRTDIIKIRDAVARLADLEALRPKLPVITDAVVVNAVGMAADEGFTGAMVTAAVTTLRDALTAHVVAPPNPRATLYYGLISQTLGFLQDKMPALPDIPANPINKYIYDTIGRMGDLVVDMVGHEGNAPVFTNKVDLLMEDIFHVMAMAQVPRTDISGMLNPVGAQAPVGAAAKRSYIFNSGMKATTCITNALHEMQTRGNKPVAIADRLTVGYASDIYFESRSLIANAHAERVFAPAAAIGLGAAGGPIARDVFFFDFLPNAAAKFSEVSAHDGVAVVRRAI